MKPTWIEIAELELGVKEIPGAKHHPRILTYHDTTTLSDRAAGRDETPWCSSFVNWVLEEAGFVGTDSALASSWLSWGMEVVDPQVGAITVIRRKADGPDKATGSRRGYHVGFCVESVVNGGPLRLLGGNQRDQVKVSSYPLHRYNIKGYRWPALRA